MKTPEDEGAEEEERNIPAKPTVEAAESSRGETTQKKVLIERRSCTSPPLGLSAGEQPVFLGGGVQK